MHCCIQWYFFLFPFFHWFRGGGTPIYVGRYHLPVLRPLFYANLTPNDPVFHYSPHPMTFFFFFHNFNVKFQIFRALRPHFKIFANFQLEKVNFHSNLTKITPNDPLLWEVHTKKGPLFGISHPMTPFYYQILHECPLFSFFGRHIPFTFIFECPPPTAQKAIFLNEQLLI